MRVPIFVRVSSHVSARSTVDITKDTFDMKPDNEYLMVLYSLAKLSFEEICKITFLVKLDSYSLMYRYSLSEHFRSSIGPSKLS